MPYSHHSHSGQFCGHATNTLQEVIEAAIAKGMTTFCLTEHIARQLIDFYPGEAEVHTPESLAQLYDDFYHTARRLQEIYSGKIQLFVGFEGEWIREYSVDMIHDLLRKYPVDLFVGSVHHVCTFPIDHDYATYLQAREATGGSDEKIFEVYFDNQMDMLAALRPPVVGHFDLIRLRSDDPNGTMQTWPGVWDRILRNLKFIADYGGVLELNSSALRKGMVEAYPKVDICKEFIKLGGRFTLSDDSLGIEQVGLNYHKVRDCMNKAGITDIYHLAPASETTPLHDSRFSHVGWKVVSVEQLDQHAFWKA